MIVPRYIGYVDYIGNGKISGNVLVDGFPRSNMTALLFENNMIIRSTLTDTSGYYEFKHLDPALKYDVLMKDPQGIWESKVSSRRTPLV